MRTLLLGALVTSDLVHWSYLLLLNCNLLHQQDNHTHAVHLIAHSYATSLSAHIPVLSYCALTTYAYTLNSSFAATLILIYVD